ncbi:conserved hypothetical protein [Pediculus humanus corporis]|uniref:Secreted protein n=1 Tax=Pediculus humanus subsp. corporis TaxID=121224 RepID=E0W4K9_PEDHC|nr:uncharacterized protein Phum_PHUM623580 [Pediculus humanus corporis]EEB20565.1 conserved hypothetical protein [Pediculus humanus corporis]
MIFFLFLIGSKMWICNMCNGSLLGIRSATTSDHFDYTNRTFSSFWYFIHRRSFNGIFQRDKCHVFR